MLHRAHAPSRLNLVLRLLLAAALLLLTAGPARAQRIWGQTFTVPAAPFTRLRAISATGFHLDAGFARDLTIAAYSRGAPVGHVVGPALFSQFIPAIPGGASATPELDLRPGGLYVLLLSPVLSGDWLELGPADLVPGGHGATCDWDVVGVVCSENPLYDVLGFTATFVAAPTATVPEPSTWALMSAGLLALACAAARRARGGRGPDAK